MQPSQQQIQQALQAGYSPQEIQSFLGDRLRPVKQKPSQPQKAGRAGGLKGFALDILPFGRVAEKTFNPNAGKITGGELLTEGALTLLPFGLGRIGKAAKAGKAAISRARSGERVTPDAADVFRGSGASTAAPARSSSAERLFNRQRGADALTAKGSGLEIGRRLGGTRGVEDAVSVFQRHSITGTPKSQLKKIDQTVMPRLGQQVDEALERSPVPLSGQNVRTRVQQAVSDPLKYADLNLELPGVQKSLGAHLKKFESSTSAKELNDYIKTLNPTAIRAQDKLARGVGLTDKETAALAAKKAGDEVLTEIPEISPLKKDMAVLFERYGDVSKQVGKKSNIPIVGGMLGSVPGDIAKSAQSRVGARMAGSAPATQRSFGAVGQAARILAPQAGVRAGAQALDMRDQGVIPEATQPEPTGAEDILGGMDPESLLGGMAQAPEMSEAQQRAQMFMEGAQRAAMAGDLEASEQLMGLAEQMSAVNESMFGEAGEATEQQEKMQAGKTVVDNLMGVYDQAAGGAQGVYQGTAADILGRFDIGESNQRARAYEQNRMSYLTPIIKAFGEVGVLTDKDREVIAEAIPSVKDSPVKAEQKRQLLYTMLESLGSSSPSSGGGLDAALQQAVQQQIQASMSR